MLSIQSKLTVFLALLVVAIAVHADLPAPPDTVVATQGGVAVTLADVDAFSARMPVGQRANFFNSPTRIEGVVTNLLMQKQLANEARKLGLDKDPELVSGNAVVTDEVLAKARMQRFRAEVKIPDFDELAQEQYLAHKEKYVTPGTLTVKQILISTASRSEADAQAIADTVEKEAKAHPDQFDALIEKYSDDPTKATNHGVMEQVGEKDKYVEPFSKAAKALTTTGEISPVVSTSYGLHVLQLVERTQDHQRSFAEVKPELVAKLQGDYVDKAVKDHTEELRNQPMDANAEAVASLRTRYGSVAAIPKAAGN